jgi:hypothetical protein
MERRLTALPLKDRSLRRLQNDLAIALNSATTAENRIVACQFPLKAKLPQSVSHPRMEKEHGAKQTLEQIHEMIAALKVFDFMANDGVPVCFRCPVINVRRQNNDRANKPDKCR